MDDLEVGILEGIRNKFGGHLVDDGQTLAIGADLGQDVGEHLAHLGLGIGVVRGVVGGAQDTVSLFDDRQVEQPARFGRAGALVLCLAVLIHEVHQQRHGEALVGIVAQLLQVDDHRAVEQVSPGGGDRLVEQVALPAAHQAADARAYGGGDVIGDALFVALGTHQGGDAVVQLAQGGALDILRRQDVFQPALAAIQVNQRLLQDDRQDLVHRKAGIEDRLQAIHVRHDLHGGTSSGE